MNNRALTVGLLLASAGLAGFASATTTTAPDSSERGAKSATVRYHEQDLATSEGAKRLYSSLDRAAHEVCDDTGEYALARSFADCERTAIADAVAQVDNAKLTAVYDRHYPNQPLSEAVSLRLLPAILVITG
jgi:UrcA family protein